MKFLVIDFAVFFFKVEFCAISFEQELYFGIVSVCRLLSLSHKHGFLVMRCILEALERLFYDTKHDLIVAKVCKYDFPGKITATWLRRRHDDTRLHLLRTKLNGEECIRSGVCGK